MKKAITIFLALLAVGLFCWIFYLNDVVLPAKVRSALTEFIESSTDYKIHIGPTRFNILRGVVFSNILLSDGNDYIITAEEVSCGFFIPPLFKKQIIIPSVKVNSPTLYVERKPDGSIAIADVLAKLSGAKNDKIGLVIHNITIRDARIKFVDLKVDPAFEKEIDSVNASIWLRMPAAVTFSVTRKKADELLEGLEISGSYDITAGLLKLKTQADRLDPRAFAVYYKSAGLSITVGRVDIFAEAELKDGAFHYGGVCDMLGIGVSGIDTFKMFDRIEGRVKFSGSGLESDDMDALIFGIPVKLKAMLTPQPQPTFELRISASTDLSTLVEALQSEFGFELGEVSSGHSRVVMDIKYDDPSAKTSHVKGSIEVSDGALKIFGGRIAVTEANGAMNFTREYVNWSGLRFNFGQKAYSTSGELSGLGELPRVRFDLSSDEIDAQSDIEIAKDIITINSCSGRYLNSAFSIVGEADISDPSAVDADIYGLINLDLTDLGRIFKKSKERIARAKLKGVVRADFTLGGFVGDLRSCEIEAKVSSDSVSFYGFKASSINMDYLQTNGAIELSSLKSSIYGGSLDASARMDLAREDLPYSFVADIKGARIEKIKADTGFKDKDIYGAIKLSASAQGFYGMPESVKGFGKLNITNGNLWQLNLFKGLGMLFFTSDFSDVVFREGYCSFIIDNGAVFTNDIELKSDLLYLYGPLKIDFKNNVSANIKAELTDEAMDSGLRQNIAATIGRYTLVQIDGTLKDPKYKLRPDLGGIVEGIQETLFQ